MQPTFRMTRIISAPKRSDEPNQPTPLKVSEGETQMIIDTILKANQKTPKESEAVHEILTGDQEASVVLAFDHFQDKIQKYHYQCKCVGVHDKLDEHLRKIRVATDYLEEVYQGIAGQFKFSQLNKGVVKYWRSNEEAIVGIQEFNQWLRGILMNMPVFRSNETLQNIIIDITALNQKFVFILLIDKHSD